MSADVVAGQGVVGRLRALWLFTRPHAFLGTLVAVLVLHVLAVVDTSGARFSLFQVLLTMLPCAAAAVFIVGINQVTDVEIDRLNKPELPLAAGTLTLQHVKFLLAALLPLSLLTLVPVYSKFLLATVLISLVVGVAYSVPPLRLKRWPLMVAVCITLIRGPVINIGLFLHFKALQGGDATLSPAVQLLVVLFLVLSGVIAWMKDVPDVEGDTQHGITTMASRLGEKTIFVIGTVILCVLFVGVAVVSIAALPSLHGGAMAGAHGAFALVLARRAQQVDATDRASITAYYQLVWQIFQLEYIIVPLAALVA